MVLPSTKNINESSMKKIVLMSIRSMIQPKMVNPPVFDCTYATAKNSTNHYENTICDLLYQLQAYDPFVKNYPFLSNLLVKTIL